MSKWRIIKRILLIGGSILMAVITFICYLLSTPYSELSQGMDEDAAEQLSVFKKETAGMAMEYGFIDMEGLEWLPGETEVIYFSQRDEQWSSLRYDQRRMGSQTIYSGGCGPTSLAIVYSSLTGDIKSPAEMAQWAVEEGFCAAPQGSYRSLFSSGAEKLGLTCVYQGRKLEEALPYLSEGCLVVALMGPGIFCDSGHFVVLRGLTEDGHVLMADCWSEKNNTVEWETNIIYENLKMDNGACLWVLAYEEEK